MPISAANRTQCEKYAVALEPLVDKAAQLSPEQLVVASSVVTAWVDRVQWLAIRGGWPDNQVSSVQSLRDSLEKIGLPEALQAEVIVSSGRAAAESIPAGKSAVR